MSPDQESTIVECLMEIRDALNLLVSGIHTKGEYAGVIPTTDVRGKFKIE